MIHDQYSVVRYFAGNVGESGDQFSVEIHHGGFFAGSGHLRSYVGGKVDYFDDLEADTWSLLWFDDFVEQLGYQKESNLRFYWLLPGKTLADGLRILLEDKDTNAMASVATKFRNFVLFFDHVASTDGDNWDDIVANPVADLPKVISPKKVEYMPRKVGEKLPVFYTNLEKRQVHQFDGESSGPRDSSGEDEAEEFHDSDYEMEDGDEDVLNSFVDVDDEAEPHVIRPPKDSRKAKGSRLKGFDVPRPEIVTDDEETDDEGLDLPYYDGEGEGGHNLKSFRDEDMNNPTFSVGLVFPDVKKLREAINEYAVRNRVEVRLPRNDLTRVRAHCAEGCPWNLYASHDSRMKSFVVKTYYGKHTCQKEWKVKKCTAIWIADKYIEAFRANDKMSITSLSRTIQKDFNIAPSRSKVARARRIIMRKIHGDEDQQFNSLWDYGEELRRSNPGSSFFLNLVDSRFSTCYMSIDACKRGFLSACRPIICLDGCFIKTKHGGQLLTAVGMDPNDCIFPIAMAVVEVESLVTWQWFLETLKSDLNIDNTYPWTIMTDKQKVSPFTCIYVSTLSISCYMY